MMNAIEAYITTEARCEDAGRYTFEGLTAPAWTARASELQRSATYALCIADRLDALDHQVTDADETGVPPENQRTVAP